MIDTGAALAADLPPERNTPARSGASVFAGEPRMQAAYDAVDWAATALGRPDSWPDSLRTTVGLMLRSRFAMWMCWGEDLTFFCNDAYRRDTLGKKYPWALGRPSSEVWAEIWDDVAPLVERVMRGGESTWDEALMLFLERSGYTEETYHTFSYSPLVDDSDAVAGLLCVVSEDTARVISERRITALRDLAGDLAGTHTEADVFAAAERQLNSDPYDLPFAVGYLRSDDGRSARLAFAAGVDPGAAAAPSRLDLLDVGAPWVSGLPLDNEPHTIDDLPARFAELPTGAWDTPPSQAVCVALTQPGEQRTGFVVVGVNPHRPLDADYLAFVELIAGQVSAALGRARAFRAEQLRAEQMAELDRAKTAFFTNVSHELRTPLTLLLGPAEDALADTVDPLAGPQRARVEVISRNGERLLKLVNTLLDFSRLESGRTQALFEPLDLGQLTAELAAMFSSALDRAGLSMTIDCPPLPQPAYVDREMWSKIVLNLLSNALKATFEGGITVRVHGDDTAVTLAVTDTGIGIAADEQDRLFERFHRVVGAAQRTHEGSGIGLALVAELVGLHGGAISVDSALGAGTTFTVRLPVGHAHLPAEHVVDSAPDSIAQSAAYGIRFVTESMRWLVEDQPRADSDPDAAADTDQRRVLVVDDNADMRSYIRGLLSDEYTVDTASNGAAGLVAARANPPDLVLTDVMMPVLDGFGLLTELRADPATMHIPVVMLSARSGDDAAVEGLEAGADDYLVKPFARRELLARVRANLELDRVRRVARELERNRALLAHAEQLAQVGSFEYDAVARTAVGTEQFHRMLGVSAAALRAHGTDSLRGVVHPDDVALVRAAARHTLSTGQPLDVEFRIGEGGATRTLWMRGESVHGPDNALLGVRGSIQDISGRLAAEQADRVSAAARVVAARDHEIAQELQNSLLPARTYDADHLDIAGYYQAGVAGTQVGGDWYDVIELDAGRTALVLGDVMGRGVHAAAIMGQLRATVRAYARIELAPDTLLHLLDDAVRDISEDMIVTCVYAVYDPTDQTLTYANAGHLPPLLRVPGEPTRRLTSGGPPLGAGRAWGRPETIAMPTGTSITLYTDGLVEYRGGNIDDGITRAAQVLDAADVPVQAIPGRLTDALLLDGQDDDVAVLVARVSDRSAGDRSAQRGFDSELQEVGRARDFAAARLQEWGVDESVVDDVRLIVSELVTNAILHGSPPVELRVRLGGDRVLIETLDSAVTTPQLRHAEPTDGNGRGLLIVSMLAERWGTRPTAMGKSVWCQVRLP